MRVPNFETFFFNLMYTAHDREQYILFTAVVY